MEKSRWSEQRSEQRVQHSERREQSMQSVQSVQQEERVQRTEHHYTRQMLTQQRVESAGDRLAITSGRPGEPSPPIFEQIFKNARFAQGGNAKFEGKLRGNPTPVVSWTRKKAPLVECNKYSMSYNEQTGDVSLLIKQIGPGDEGEYTCTARNQYGEAICSVYIQPEGVAMPAQQASQQQQSYRHVSESVEHKSYGTQGFTSEQSRQTQKVAYTNGTSDYSSSEDFKVDTFEYRLLREVSFRETITRRYVGETDIQISTEIDKSLGAVAPPKIAQKPRNSKLQEGADAQFHVQLSGNPRPRVTWFKNGQRLVNSNKHEIITTQNQTTLRVRNTQKSDSGHYTLLAENPNGCIVTSAYLAVESPQETYVQDHKSQYIMDTQQTETEERVEIVEKALAPQFVKVCQDRDVTEGKLTRFDCRVTGRPYPEVTWFINDRQIRDDYNHKILVNESGNHALMITNVDRSDSGVVTCVARNKSGETSFQCRLNVIEKEQVVAPKFVERFSTLSIREGEPVALNARAVGTPTPRITWQKDGVPIIPNPELRINTDGGTSTLDIPRAKASDAAWYQCTAQNVAGSTATRARLYVEVPKEPPPEQKRLHLPRPTRIIEPEPAPGPEVIYLRHVERARPYVPAGEEDRVYPPPQFIVPLKSVSQMEGGKIHFETRIEPVGDPTMKIEWLRNGQSIEASSRFTSIFRFGYISLDMLSLNIQDSGEYTCRAVSATGVAETKAMLQVTPRATIERTSQHPESLQYIQQLEDYSRYQHQESIEENISQRPQFIRPLQELGELQEGRNAHFEAQLTPVSDPHMRVEWYKDGRPITASSRITSIFNFGYVSLNIMHLRAEDAGSYTVRAVNKLGEAVSTASIRVAARSTVTSDLGIPEQRRYIEKTEQLEAYQQQQNVKYYQEVPESTQRPEFKTPIKDQINVKEGGFAHFEARLEPVGDSTLKVEWLKDGRPVEASSRITTFFNFGYVALTIKSVTVHDAGHYTCRAYNALGQATTSAQCTIVTKKDIIAESQHPGGLEKIQHLEDSSRYMRRSEEEVRVTQKPRFLGPLKGTNKIVEGQSAHFEARVEPQSDLTMSVEWYFNGKQITQANRTQTYHDFGYVALDISNVRAEDSGTYTVVARNAAGEAQLSTSMVVETRSSIDTTSIHRGLYEKTRHLEESKFVEPMYQIEEISKSKPIFVQPLSDPAPVSEGKNIHLECRLEPMGDPTMRVEWFHNGRAVTVGSRFRTYYDFGFVALDIIHATSTDSGEYTVRAVNHLGSAHTSAMVRVIERSDILTETQNEQAVEQIQMLEDAARRTRQTQEDITVMQAPQFSRSLHNVETVEGTNVHLECRLQPVGDPTMRVDWFCNGRPIKTGHRFRPAYEFDYVALDLLSVYPEDSGVYTCQATNQLGEAVTSCALRVIAKKDLYFESQHPSGLEKIQYLEDTSRYKKSEMIDETINIKPHFVTKPKSIENVIEGHHVHFECKLEPVTDPNLKVEWFKNGQPVTIGHRFRPIHDFGYVALDIIDLIAEDSGVYTCRAINHVGTDEVNCRLSCRGTADIIRGTQNEAGLEQIQHLEDRTRYNRTDMIDEITTQAPIFTSSLKNIEIKEGQRAHFECRLIPVSDPTMKVEWYHNNRPLKSGSRFTETNNFGFVALDIMSCLPEDSGTYTCRAINALGEAVTSGIAIVHSKKSIYLESQHEGALGRLNQLEDTSRYQRHSAQDEFITQAPVFTMPMKDIKVAENQAVHFEARLIPVGDPKLRVEWLRNGVPIEASNRLTTMHDFGYVALNMKYVNPEDSGTYTCRAINEQGEAVTSSTLFVQSKASLQYESQHESALEKIQQLEDSSRHHQRREEVDIAINQAPRFVTQLNGPSKLVEGQSAHYECRIEPYPDPNMRVEWYFNGKVLQSGHRYRTAYDFGFAALDILQVYGEDSGEYTCKVINNLGQATSSIKLHVQSKESIIRDTQHESALEKIQYLEDDSRNRRIVRDDSFVAEKPQFGKPLKNTHVGEGHPVHLEATLTPVNDPTMRVEWYCNGRPVAQGHRFKTTYDFGYVALDVLYAYSEDTGTYMCKATNAVGEAVTTCSVKVDAKAGLYLDTLDEQRLKKIQELEKFERPKTVEEEKPGQRPVFLTALTSLENLKESDRAHFECRVEPINDPDLQIEWFLNGKKIRAGHRYRTTHDFGYVALDILYAYAEDSGTYMCKATNKLGEAVNTCTMKVAGHRSIILDTQHPNGLEKIRKLEAQGHHTRMEVEEPKISTPKFVTELRGTTHVYEGQTAHFECQVEPIHDPNLRIEFYHNGKALQSASRFHITFDFGYVSLDIQHCVPEDAGEYSVKAINALGQCTSAISMTVTAKGSIILESQRPEGLEKIRELESVEPFKRPEIPEPVTRQRPVFTQPLQNIDNIQEGQTAHFDCRLIPVGDPTLKVEWFRNEKLIEDSSRITKTHDFGYVSMTITHVRDEDEGVYMCRASNLLGEAVTTAAMKIKTKAAIQLETQHPEGMKKIQRLEEPSQRRADEPEREFEKPIFTQVLTGPSELWEGQHAHYEARVVPVGDPSLRFEWYINGVELKMGSRFRTTHDFGFVTLDINSVVAADAGLYMCKAINRAGSTVSSTSLKVKSKSTIVDQTMRPESWEQIQLKEAAMNKVPEMFIDAGVQQAPIFTTHLKSYDKLVEGQHVYLEAQVEPRTDPNLRIEWFKNGISLTTGSRIKSTFDFGLVTLSVNGLRIDDSGIYTCKATNLMGEAVSTASIKIEDRHWLLGESLHPESLDRIGALEQPKATKPESPEPIYEIPVFISHLNNIICKEGDNIHFECNVEPSRDPTLKIEWFFNNKPLPSGTRYKATHDFSYVSLDVTHTYEEDSGIYTCKATNSKGSATTSGSLRCTGDKHIYLDTQHPQGKFGLEAVEQAEEARLSKGRRPSVPDADYPKPEWVIPVAAEHQLVEGQSLHLEGQVEPKNDPNLKIEWYFNGKVLQQASRFKLTSDFGFVTLDLTSAYERDSGIYTCKAYNKKGEAFTSSTIFCSSKDNLIEGTQHPKGTEGLEKIQNLEDSLRREPGQKPDDDAGRAPEFTTVFQDIVDISEGQIAHYEASLIPTGDQSMVIEWFYNGKTIEASHRIRTVYAFGMCVLEILGTKTTDSGTYSCRATNRWGQAEISVKLECVDKSKGQKPKFTTHIQSVEGLKDGQSAHFECTVIPVDDPDMKIEWYHNGQHLRHSTRIKTVSDFGFVVMDIAYTQNHDAGEYVCRAYNKYGEDFTKATISCYGRSGVYLESLQPDSLAKIRELENLHGAQQQTPSTPSAEPPKFLTQIQDVTKLVEGQSAHFEARLVPVDDPDLKVEWFYNGKKLPHGHRYRTFHDFGIVILDILYCYEENSGVYECVATNKLGRDSTKATLKCTSKENLILDSQLPRGMEGGLEKLQTLEDSMIRRKDTNVQEERGKAPMFTVPLSNIENLREGENAHFEARLTPTDDPNLKVEWYWNGKSLKAGSRFRTFCDFGFVILEISPTYPEDSGEYLCRAYNNYGEAVTTATMKVAGKRNIILESQLPKGMEGTIDKIAVLEGYTGTVDSMTPEVESGNPPEFITTPSDLILSENSSAHFECRLVPINDSSMRVEWYHNGKPLLTGSRVKTINDFGFVILEVGGVYQRDAGLYTCKATNRHGEATVSCKLQVKGRQGIILEPQLPSHFKSGTESIQRLEETLHKREEIMSEDEKPNPPRFTVDIKDNIDVAEGGPIHFDCRVEPVGDPTMRIDWFHNGRPFATGSRVHMLNDFGFIALDIDYIYARDAGEYTCRATNRWGSATTTARITCSAKRDIVLESQLPQGMSGEKIKELERGRVSDVPKEDPIVSSPPKFITQIQSHTVEESEGVRFECRVEPKEDPKLRIEWYRNGKMLPSGHRYRTVYDMGFVSLDILYVYAEDSGEYMCRAVNDFGEDFTKGTVSCKQLPDIILQNQVPRGMKKSEALTQMEATIKKYTSEIFLTEDDLYDTDKKQPPRFVTQIQSQTTLVEMETTKFECQLAPVGDPNMKVEWFFNGKPLLHKNRFTPIYDFGYVAMNFGWVYPEDSGEYVCRATNLYGMDETRAIIKTAGKPGIVYDSQLPKHMKSIEKIREMEASWQVAPEQAVEAEKARSPPVFVSRPDPVTVEEGEWARFCCRVTGHPKPRVMWLINGNTIVNGSRYKLTYDGMYHFDIPKTRQYDTGKIEVIARSSVGEAVATTELKVIPRHDDYRGVLKNAPRRIIGTKEYRKPEWVTHMEELQAALKATQSVPTFVKEILGERVHEEETVKFEAIYSGNPEPEILWYKDDKVIRSDDLYTIDKAENRTWCVVKKATKENEGMYMCKAVSDIGMAITKAKLQVFKEGEIIQKAKTVREKTKLEKTVKREKEVVEKVQAKPVLTEATETVTEEVQGIEEPKPMKKVGKEKATVKLSSAEHVETVDVASYKKIDKKEKPAPKQEKLKPAITPHEHIVSSQQQKEETVQPFEKTPIEKQKGIIKTVESDSKMVAEINELLEVINAKEFGPGESPLRELAKIGYMLRTGVTTNEIESLYDSQYFPALRVPQSQSALVQLVERQGHGALITEVLTEETTQDEDVIAAKVGFRAFLKMVEMKASSVEEVIAHFYPEDFKPRSWEQREAHEVIVESSAEHVAESRTTKVIKDTREVTEIQRTEEAEASMKISREIDFPETPLDVRSGDTVFAVYSYVAETDEAINLVEGERLYILETTNQDWWFVCKHLTEEKGFVPAQYLMDEENYTLYLQKKLNEKIDKLPVFEKPTSEEQAVAPIFVEKLRPKHTPDGSTVQFECQVEGFPRPQITWFRQTAIIKPSQDFQMYYDDDNVATLVIREVFPEDAGTFTCVAKNAAGFASSTTELIVEAPLSDHGSEMTILSRKSLSRESSLADILEGIPPTFSKKPKAQYVNEGSQIFLECRLVAIPEPDIAWFFKGEEIVPDENISIATESDMHMYCSVLKISNVKKLQEGTYTVLAVNREGEASLPIVLKIKTGQKEKPQVIEPLKSLTIREGESVVLSAQVVGNPQPTVTWYRNNKPVPSLPTKSDGETHTVTIIKPRKGKDDGVYTLKAANSEGTAETSAVITIEEPTEENAEPPLFINRFQEITVKEKGTVKLSAKVTGNPVPSITWYRNNQIITPSETVTQNFDGENIELVITNVDSEIDSGDYKCVASNSAGKASHGARVTIDVEKVTFVKKLKTAYEIEEGKTIILECQTSHTVSTKWYHNDKELSGMDHREIIQEGRTHKLRIKKTKLTDKGVIKCVVKDQETSTKLQVHETIPEFTRKLQDFEVKERDVAILEVEINSETADVIWERDGERIKAKKNKYELEKRGNVRKLLIRNTSVHDEGEYTCILRDDMCTAEVTVVELPPEIISRLQDQKVNKGNKATFEIDVTKGDALVQWFKDGEEIQFSNHMQLTIDGKKQKLKIYDCDDDDAGEYACEVGSDRCTATLIVEEPSIDFTLRLPEVITVPANTDAYLTVEIPDETYEVTWFKKKTVIEDSEKYTLISDVNKRTLVIRKCTEEDQTEYTVSLLDAKCSTKLKVEVIELPPKILDFVNEYRVKRGGDVTLQVQYEALPQPADEWVVNSKIIKKSKHTKPSIDSESASLTIKKVENTDAGSYKLKLVNHCGEAEIEINVIVMDVSSPPGKPSPLETDDTSINICWNEPENTGNSVIICYIVEYQEINTTEWISIENVTKTHYCVSDLKTKSSYRFRIFAVNEVGVSEASEVSEYVVVEKVTTKQPPSVEKPLKDIIVGPNEDVELSCIFGGIPQPKVAWSKDGSKLKTAKASYDNRVATLVVTSTITSEGEYKCTATNELGEIDTTCKLEIQQKPIIIVQDNEINQRHKVDEEWSATATFEGIPKPSIVWYRNGTKIESSKELEIITTETTSTIRIRMVDRSHTSKYTIEAQNKAGSSSVELSLKVYDKPSKPGGPVVMREISRESVTIEWKPPVDDGGLELTKYAIEKHEPETNQWVKVADVDKTVETYCIQRLNENCEYMFRVMAQNPIGYSEALESEPIVIKHALDVPSPPLGPLGIYGISSDFLTITWYPSEKNGGSPILDYSVEIKQEGKTWKHVATVTTTSAKIEKLTTNTTYQFRICARNEIGTSLPYTSEERVTIGKTLSPPSQPQKFAIKDATSRSVTLQWAAPESDGGSVVTNYIIEYKTVNAKSWTKIITVGGSVYEHCIENIKDQEIVFRISAENAIGVGPATESQTVRLEKHATVPSPPTGPLEIRLVGSNIVMTSWGTPEWDGGAPLQGYNIAIRDVTKTMWMEVGKVDAHTLKFNVRDLSEDHTYMVRIYARNEIGLSEPLESDEPFKVLPGEGESHGDEELGEHTELTEPTSFSQTTTSWLRDHNMDADIRSYARGSLLRRDEYFFRIWHYAKQLFK